MKLPVVTRFAPTPLAPLLYVIVPVVIVASVAGVAAAQASCMFKPWTTSSTYCLVAASVPAIGVARLEIMKLPTLTVPVPVGVKLIF